MTRESLTIFNSAARMLRAREKDTRDNLHIGQTLRDLYRDGAAGETSTDFSFLLDRLDRAEQGRQ
ncbi:hypothetical protein [Ensifer soli]|uniref:hypothetical protein n=1 Tax=Ciceribacter sp. sgz301302 TaxID=3342379 RepID=UPI0035BB8F84